MGKSLVALRSDLLATCSAFIADVGRVMDVPQADPRLALLEASLERFRRQTSLKFDLPLAEMDAAAVDITTFMDARLQELSSPIRATRSHWGRCHADGSAQQPGMGVGSKPRPGPE